ncbi:VPS10 domain-containing receptor SorCS1-like [Salvelinus alpinus]|uniref:VPS10 domain-containing receptor SorCS1-like n=1 Tax=Salvelinus alpinus TaxID=8036 RepID=UPI0039FDA6E9
MRTNIQLDFEDGMVVSFSNLNWIEEGSDTFTRRLGYYVSRPWRRTPWVFILPPCICMLLPVISLDGSISYTFTSEGMNTVTVQVSSANAILQDTKTIAVQEFFKSLFLSFSPNLDEYNTDVPSGDRMWGESLRRLCSKKYPG